MLAGVLPDDRPEAWRALGCLIKSVWSVARRLGIARSDLSHMVATHYEVDGAETSA